MSDNWLRHFELDLVDSSGNGIALTDFKVKFHIEWSDTRWPRIANFWIYNLDASTITRIKQKEFSEVVLIAGYDGIPSVDGSAASTQNYGKIFRGAIRYSVEGKDNLTDSWLLIQSSGDHEAFIYANVKTTLAAGHTAVDIHKAAVSAFGNYGVTQGLTGEMPSTIFPRGRTIYKPARDVMDGIASMSSSGWQINDGAVQLIPKNKYIQEAILLNCNTGLIGMPQQTMNAGVNVRCLINPNIKINGLIELNQGSVYRTALTNQDIGSSPTSLTESTNGNSTTVTGVINQPASIAADGVYVVKSIEYTGDTRGQAWYMDMMCQARGTMDLLSSSSLQKTT